MSLILEALRKSEAERRRAQVPDLLAETQAAAPVAARAAPRWPLFAGGAVVALAVVWFAATREATPPTQLAPATPTETPADSTPAETEVAAPASSHPAPALQRPLVVAAPAPATPAVANPAPATEPPAQPIASTPTALAAPPRAEPIATPPPAPVAAAPAASPSYVERVTDLGNADRKQLPPLKLSMHMWNDVVAQRFVIIDGARLGVGDRLGSVVVADIEPDGVLLDWNGRTLKLPLR